MNEFVIVRSNGEFYTGNNHTRYLWSSEYPNACFYLSENDACNAASILSARGYYVRVVADYGLDTERTIDHSKG